MTIDAHPLTWFDQSRDDIKTDEFFGEYVYAPTPNQWCNSWSIGTRADVRVFGPGRDPTAEQQATMKFILGIVDELESLGGDAIPDPPVVKPDQIPFDRTSVAVREIWITEKPDQFMLVFTSTTGDDIHSWPIVEFQGTSVIDAWWAG